ncbi:MAG: glycoside hydrolase family 16 protein [Rikenellaceae bacterium]
MKFIQIRNTAISTLLLLIVLSVFVSCKSYKQASNGDSWEMVWNDEFNSVGAPDSAKWSFEKGFVRNNEAQWYQEDNAYQKDGSLIIEGRVEKMKNPNFEINSNNWKTNREYVNYTSSSIKTVGKFSFTYGRVEVRAKIPTTPGAWPAIWTLGDSMSWPSCGEIDIMEFYRVNSEPTILANGAWGTDKPYVAKWKSSHTPLTHFITHDQDWANKFHIWVMEWDENAIKLLLDDELLNEISIDTTINGIIGENKNPFKQPHYLLLNLALGGNNGGEIDDSHLPMKYEIDYVRVFQKMKN